MPGSSMTICYIGHWLAYYYPNVSFFYTFTDKASLQQEITTRIIVGQVSSLQGTYKHFFDAHLRTLLSGGVLS
jgi:hypothetical protein